MSFLNGGLSKIFNKIRGKKYVNSNDIEFLMKDIRLSFIEADVNYEVITKFNHLVKQKTLGLNVSKGLTTQEQVIKVIKDILIDILGSQNIPLKLTDSFNVFLLIGLQGSGKTTVSGKLSFFIHKKYQKKILLIAADIYRFGAIEQLISIGKKINIEVFFQKNETVLNIIRNGLEYARYNGFEVVIIDTAGRLTLSPEMMEEIKQIKLIAHPQEILIITDALLGQQSVKITQSFHQQINATGVILTKMDADIKGGVALSIKQTTDLPIKFIASSEKHDDENFEVFFPERIASRLLDMGDLLTLIETVEEKIKTEQDTKILNRLLQNDYNYYDLDKQLVFLQKMGSMKKILQFIPGINSKLKNIPMLENNLILCFRSLIQSMTKEEKLKPKLILDSTRRRNRIVKGSGRQLNDLNILIKFMEKQKQVSYRMNSFDDDFFKNSENLLNEFLKEK
ncbi:MAG: signal recognition particle receptor subunit alpha [Vigna little leaf phytoplasma]|nr:signal recognition particle receptor subunit alpha [Vigna little leaf phytoplasma]